MVLSQLSYSPTCAQESILADLPSDCQCRNPWLVIGNDKVFLRAADKCIEHVPGFRREHALYPAETEINLPRREYIGENDVEMRSPFRMESPPRSLRDPLRACARKAARGKAPRVGYALPVAGCPLRNGRFSGIENRPHVIRGRGGNIKKVYGNRHFPVDTVNVNF